MNDETRYMLIVETIIKICNIIKQIILVWIISYYIYLSIKSLAGTTTITNIVIEFFMEKTITERLSYIANLFLLFIWHLERKKRLTLIKSKSK